MKILETAYGWQTEVQCKRVQDSDICNTEGSKS